MKAVIDSVELSKNLKKMSGVVKKNNIIPITECVKFSFSKDSVTITANNTETAHAITMDCKCKQPFDVLIDYFDIAEIAASIYSPLTIEAHPNKVILTSETSKTTLPFISDPDNFPTISEEGFHHSKDVDGSFFYHLSKASSCRYKKDNNNPNLDMPNVILRKNDTVIVGSDGYILYKYEMQDGNPKELNVMVPDGFVNLCKSFQDSVISFSNKFIRAVYKKETVVSRLSENKFPDVMRILPASVNINLTIPKKSLLRILNVISVSMDFSTKQCNISFAPNKLIFKTVDILTNKESEAFLDVEHSISLPDMILQSGQLIHLLSLIDTDDVCFQITSEKENVYMQPSDNSPVLILIRPLVFQTNQ